MNDPALILICLTVAFASLAMGLKIGFEVIRFGFRSLAEWAFFAGASGLVLGACVMFSLAVAALISV